MLQGLRHLHAMVSRNRLQPASRLHEWFSWIALCPLCGTLCCVSWQQRMLTGLLHWRECQLVGTVCGLQCQGRPLLVRKVFSPAGFHATTSVFRDTLHHSYIMLVFQKTFLVPLYVLTSCKRPLVQAALIACTPDTTLGCDHLMLYTSTSLFLPELYKSHQSTLLASIYVIQP